MAASAEKKAAAKRRGNRGLGRSETRIAGRFRSTYTNTRLYEVVRKAALDVRPSCPKDLRQTEFDDARAYIGHADCPTARQIAKRLDRPWVEIVSDAVDQIAQQTQKDAMKQKSDEAPWLTGDHVFYALRRAAKHLGQPTLTRDQYTAAREELLAIDKKRHRFGGILEENLPTADQIERVARNLIPSALSTDWEKACEVAKIAKPGSAEADGIGSGAKKGVAIFIAIHYYVEASGGLLPSSRTWLERFAKKAGFAMARQPKGTSFPELIHQANAHRKTLGLEPASEFAPASDEVEFDFSKLPLESAPTAIVKLSYEEKLAKIAEFLDYCDKHKSKPIQKLYKGLAPKKGWPSDSKLGEGMKWGEWISAADEWRAKKLKQAA